MIIPGDGVKPERGMGGRPPHQICFIFQPLTLRSNQKGELMEINHFFPKGAFFKRTIHQLFIYILIIILMSNLSALVDVFLHPEIPYFDTEHLIVGGVTGLVSSILLGLLIFYTWRLEKALKRINKIESFLPICANCKKIRIPNLDPHNKESWQSIESYITEKTATLFSHGICPECAAALYPQVFVDICTDNY